MGLRRVLRAAVAAAVLLVPAAPAAAETVPCSGTDTPVSSSTASATEQAVACLVDRERASRGLPRLAVEPRVAAAAQAHAQDMLDRGYFSHTAPAPKPATADARLRAQGYEPASFAEAIGQGQTTARAVVRAWMQSSVHCGVLLAVAGPDAPYGGPVHLGVGVAGGGSSVRWNLLVARPQGVDDPGAPATAPSCPATGLVAEDAQVQPFGGAGPAPAPADPGTPPPVPAPAPAGASAAGITPPALASSSGSLFAGDVPELTVEASPDALLHVSVTDFRGRRRELGDARPIPGAAGTHAGTALFALPTFRLVSAVEVAVTDGRTTVTRKLVPVAVLRGLRARRTAAGLRVTGRLVPGLAGKAVRVTAGRGKAALRRTVRTGPGGRFAVVLPSTAKAVRVVAPGDHVAFRRASGSARVR